MDWNLSQLYYYNLLQILQTTDFDHNMNESNKREGNEEKERKGNEGKEREKNGGKERKSYEREKCFNLKPDVMEWDELNIRWKSRISSF